MAEARPPSSSVSSGAQEDRRRRSWMDETAALDAGRRVSDATNYLANDGMRREWNFFFCLSHQSARVRLQWLPQWRSGFIEPELTEASPRLDEDATHVQLLTAVRYTDLSAVMATNTESLWLLNPTSPQFGSISVRDNNDLQLPEATNAAAGGHDLWLSKTKHIEVLYTRVAPGMTLAQFCVRCVQHILRDPRVISVDGDPDLSALRVGDKLRCPHRLGGRHSSLHFYFRRLQRAELVDDSCYAIGTVVGQRGYLIVVRCAEEHELERYLLQLFLPHYTSPAKLTLDADVQYASVAAEPLAAPQRRYGELHYADRDAAIAFDFPMLPMRLRPDFSPVKTVGVGSIACLTLELQAYTNLVEDAAVAELTGMPRYTINDVVLCLDVEDVARMDLPRVMSTEQYSELKTERLLRMLRDAKAIGSATTVQVGHRIGRGRTMTFTYEPLQSTVKAVWASTLVGSLGVTALYLARPSGGAFDNHLYLYQQLLHAVTYHPQRVADQRVSRFRAANVRLLDSDLPRAYEDDAGGHAAALERHLLAMRASNEGNAEGAVEVLVTPEEGGLPPSMADEAAATGVSRAARLRGSAARSSASPEELDRGSITASVYHLPDALPAEIGMHSFYCRPSAEGDAAEGPSPVSPHSSSSISVSTLPHLANKTSEDFAAAETGAEARWVTQLSRDETEAESRAAGLSRTERPSTSASSGQARSHSTSSDCAVPLVEVGEIAAPRPAAHTPLDNSATSQRSTSASGTRVREAAPSSGGWSLSGVGQPPPHRNSTCLNSSQALSAAATEAAMAAAVDHAQAVIDEGAATAYIGSSLQAVYRHCCELQHCRPNSYLLAKLPSDPRFTSGVEEVDLSANYLGQNGFVALLHLLTHLPQLRRVYLNNMSLGNADVAALCEVLARHPTITTVHLKKNPNISLPATRHLTRLLQANPRITSLELEGTRLGERVIQKLKQEAEQRAA